MADVVEGFTYINGDQRMNLGSRERRVCKTIGEGFGWKRLHESQFWVFGGYVGGNKTPYLLRMMRMWNSELEQAPTQRVDNLGEGEVARHKGVLG